MSDHYFSKAPESAHAPQTIRFCVGGRELQCRTDAGTFSRDRLDPGSALLLSQLPAPPFGRALDLGCGWGALALGLAALDGGAQVVACDVNQRALDLCRENFRENGLVVAAILESDGFAGIEGTFDLIVTNPPIRAGKAVIYRFFADSRRYLAPEGALWLVIRKQQGAPSAKAYLETLFGQVDLVARQKGYWVLSCRRPKDDEEGPRNV